MPPIGMNGTMPAGPAGGGGAPEAVDAWPPTGVEPADGAALANIPLPLGGSACAGLAAGSVPPPPPAPPEPTSPKLFGSDEEVFRSPASG